MGPPKLAKLRRCPPLQGRPVGPVQLNWCKQHCLLVPASLVAGLPNSCAADDATSTLMPPLLVLAAILWVTMLSSIGLQLGGADPGVESTYWWMGGREEDGKGKDSRKQNKKKKTTRVVVTPEVQEMHARPVD